MQRQQQEQQEEDGWSRRFPFNYPAASGGLVNKVLRTTTELKGRLFTSAVLTGGAEGRADMRFIIPLIGGGLWRAQHPLH